VQCLLVDRVPSCTNINLRLLAISVSLSHYFWKDAKIAHDEVIFFFPGLKKNPKPHLCLGADLLNGLLFLPPCVSARRAALPRPLPHWGHRLSPSTSHLPGPPAGSVPSLCPGVLLLTAGAGTVPAHLSLASGSGSSERLDAPSPVSHRAPQRLCFPLPHRPLLRCDPESQQVALAPHPSLHHRAFTGGRDQPSILRTMSALRHREPAAGRASARGPSGPGVRLACRASRPHVMQLARWCRPRVITDLPAPTPHADPAKPLPLGLAASATQILQPRRPELALDGNRVWKLPGSRLWCWGLKSCSLRHCCHRSQFCSSGNPLCPIYKSLGHICSRHFFWAWSASSFAVFMNSSLLPGAASHPSPTPAASQRSRAFVQSSSEQPLGKAQGSLLETKQTLCRGSGLCIAVQGRRNPSVNSFKWAKLSICPHPQGKAAAVVLQVPPPLTLPAKPQLTVVTP